MHLNGEENPNSYTVLRRVGPAQQPPTPTACLLGPSALISPLLLPRSLGSFPALDLRVSALAVPSAWNVGLRFLPSCHRLKEALRDHLV